MMGDDWSNVHLDGTFRSMYLKRIDVHNEKLNKLNNILAHEYAKRVCKLIDDKISECELGIEEVINGEKDSFIVKHDIAIRMLKDLKRELEF